ncbi:MAG: DUF4911 domain-containing protein [Deltaproteobacteria bacterium]|nr:MAG: DUF4911 domain-containing protein [Deltaproteobacteria bacterium]
MNQVPERMTRVVFKVERKSINYIRNTLESYDGMALVRTLDPHKGLIEVYISPGCEKFIEELIEDLKNREGILLSRDDG